MWKFERLERRDAPAGVIKIPSLPIDSAPDAPEGEPPTGGWYNDLVVGWDSSWDNGRNAGDTGSSGGTQAPTSSTGAVDQVFATYSERDLNTDGKVDLTDFAFLKATLNGQGIGVT